MRRGSCLIINQVFEHDSEIRRNGTECDVIALKRLWSKLGCTNIVVKRDLTREKIMETLRDFNESLQISKPDYFVIVILSHGRTNIRTGLHEILDVNMNGVAIKDIKAVFLNGIKCPSMVGKPKLFIINACRQTKYTSSDQSRYVLYYIVR